MLDSSSYPGRDNVHFCPSVKLFKLLRPLAKAGFLCFHQDRQLWFTVHLAHKRTGGKTGDSIPIRGHSDRPMTTKAAHAWGRHPTRTPRGQAGRAGRRGHRFAGSTHNVKDFSIWAIFGFNIFFEHIYKNCLSIFIWELYFWNLDIYF